MAMLLQVLPGLPRECKDMRIKSHANFSSSRTTRTLSSTRTPGVLLSESPSRRAETSPTLVST